MSFITFQSVCREYKMGDSVIRALRGVDFALEEGSFNVILGQSGAGKTTVLNLLGGMDRATSGTIEAAGVCLTELDERALTGYRREKIGFVFQFYNLVPNLTALENVHLAREIAPDPLSAEEMLRRVGLEERRNNFPGQLSGGEQQRVSIARALAKNPAILLCDEPTGALDSETGSMVLGLIREVSRDMNKTAVIVTHNALVAEMADKVIHLRDGKVCEIRENPSPKNASEIVW